MPPLPRVWVKVITDTQTIYTANDGTSMTFGTSVLANYDVRTHGPFNALDAAAGPIGAITDPASLVANFEQSRLDAGEVVTT